MRTELRKILDLQEKQQDEIVNLKQEAQFAVATSHVNLKNEIASWKCQCLSMQEALHWARLV